jgi:hypothetical protein
MVGEDAEIAADRALDAQLENHRIAGPYELEDLRIDGIANFDRRVEPAARPKEPNGQLGIGLGSDDTQEQP